MNSDSVTIQERVTMSIAPPPPEACEALTLPEAEPLTYGTTVLDSGNNDYSRRILVGTAVTGLVRVEWVQARIGQMIPCNWSSVQMWQTMNSYMPLRYQVDDAQNLIVHEFITNKYEWLLLWEHDVMPMPDALTRLNEYMRRKDTPVVSGLYYSRSRPSEPLMYRGRGNSFVTDWQHGDTVWCDGVPTGFLLVHGSLLRAVWEDSETYDLAGMKVRRVFHTPNKALYDETTNTFNMASGTSDLWWCSRVIDGDYLRKAGWGAFADEHSVYPFPVDTNIFCRHINPSGEIFP